MHQDLLVQLVGDRQRRRRDTAAAQRAVRVQHIDVEVDADVDADVDAGSEPAGRVWVWRRAVGYRLVRLGLRISFGTCRTC